MFDVIHRQIEAPWQFTSVHLRRMLIVFMATRRNLVFPFVRNEIIALYRLARRDGRKLMEHTGPYSFFQYLKLKSRPSSPGDTIMLR